MAFEDANSAMTTPAANSTISGSISAEYMYTIIGVYIVIIIIVFVTVSIIIFKRLQRVIYPPHHNESFGYIPLPQDDTRTNRTHSVYRNVDELNRIVEIHGHRSSEDSEYDNISLEPDRTYDDPFGSDSDDALPDYEHPPSYIPVSFFQYDSSPEE